MSPLSPALAGALRGLAAAAAIGLVLGTLFPAWVGWLVLCLGLGFQLAYHLRHFERLAGWSARPGIDHSLEGEGVWDGVFQRVYRHEKGLRDKLARRDREIALLVDAYQALTDGVVLLDRHDRILFCNTTAEQYLGLRAEGDRGAVITNLVRQPELAAYLAAPAPEAPLTLAIERPQERVLALHVVPYAGDRRLLQVKDITRSHRLDSMRRDFVANVSHELRTPLTVLSGFLETLSEHDFPPEARAHYLALMGVQSTRMLSIVQDLLTLSSIESAPPPGFEPVDMAGLLERLLGDARALSGERHAIELSVDCEADLLGNESEIASACANLMTNAVRYTPAGGRIRITWRDAGEAGAEFSVEDTGIGIDPRHIPRLTERFYRVDRGRSREVGGTGLGLAIVKHCLNRHQARLDIQSTPGRGSRFSALFPASRLQRRQA